MPGRRKTVTMAKVARRYKRTHTKPVTENNGARYFNEGAKPYAIGSSESKSTYKPRPRAGVFGGSDGSTPTTKRVRRNKL